jgi:hypothetical protein
LDDDFGSGRCVDLPDHGIGSLFSYLPVSFSASDRDSGVAAALSYSMNQRRAAPI